MSATTPDAPTPARPWLDRARSLGPVLGAAGLVVCLLVAFVPAARRGVALSYLTGYTFWFGISLGGVALTLLHHLTGGRWGLAIRRPLEAAAMTLLPMAVLFLPIALGLGALYPWADPEYVRAHEATEHKVAYLNPTWFLIRTAGYFALWIALALVVNAWSRRQDTRDDDAPSRRLQAIAGPGLGLVFLSATFATVDWLMSLEPDWYSTIYGPMLICGWGLATFAGATIVASLLRDEPAMARVATPQLFNDLGNLMLAFTMLWAYTSFMQFLIIWNGNLAEEIPWYLRRVHGGWGVFAVLLIAFHFFAPFLILLVRDVKRRPETLRNVAVLVLVMHLVDMTWLVLPSQFINPLPSSEDPIYVPITQLLLVLAATAGIGGIWLWTFAGRLASAPVVPPRDPAAEHLEPAPHGHGD